MFSNSFDNNATMRFPEKFQNRLPRRFWVFGLGCCHATDLGCGLIKSEPQSHGCEFCEGADTVGLKAVLSRVHEYRARFGDYWEPAPLLEKLVAEGKGFS